MTNVEKEINKSEDKAKIMSDAAQKIMNDTDYDSMEYREASRNMWYYMGIAHGLSEASTHVFLGEL